MNHLKNILIAVFATTIVAFGVGFFVAKGTFAPPGTSSRTILTTLQNEGVFVTQNMILKEYTTIDTRSGNALKDFFVSENTIASADIRIALGIDMNMLTADDITIDGTTLTVVLPKPTIFSTEVISDVFIDSHKGVFTKIIDGDDDYNALVAVLKEQARASVTGEAIRSQIELGSIETITRFLHVVAPRYTVVVTFR